MTEFALPPLVAGIDIDPKESRLPKKDGTIVSNSLATFAYIRGRKKRQIGSLLDCGILEGVRKGRITSEGRSWKSRIYSNSIVAIYSQSCGWDNHSTIDICGIFSISKDPNSFWDCSQDFFLMNVFNGGCWLFSIFENLVPDLGPALETSIFGNVGLHAWKDHQGATNK